LHLLQWIVTADEDGSYIIYCLKDHSVVTFDASIGSLSGEDGLKHLWSIEARGDTFMFVVL
jgi:hypothetical protein